MNDIHIKDNGMPFVSPSDEICAGRDGNSACYRDATRKKYHLQSCYRRNLEQTILKKVARSPQWQFVPQRHREPPDLRGRRAVRHHVVGLRLQHQSRPFRLRRGIALCRLVHRKLAVVEDGEWFRTCKMILS